MIPLRKDIENYGNTRLSSKKSFNSFEDIQSNSFVSSHMIGTKKIILTIWLLLISGGISHKEE